MRARAVTIGLTGSFGTGKSAALAMFAQCGAVVLDADVLARRAVRPGQEAYGKIVHFFGKEILKADRSINRDKLAGLVFTKPALRRALNRMVHPVVIRRIKDFLRECRDARKPLCVVGVPLLYEAGLEKLFDKIVAVRAGRKDILTRVAKARGMTQREILLRTRAQMSLARKCSRADFVLDNSGALGNLRKQVRNLLRYLKGEVA